MTAIVMTTLAAAAQARPTLELKNLRAEVEIVPEDRADFAISIDMPSAQGMIDKNGAQGQAPTVDIRGENARIEANWNTGVPTFYVAASTKGYMDIAGKKAAAHEPQPHPAGLPHIRILAPKAFTIITNAQVFGHIGPSQSLKIVDNGRGDWSIDAVARDVDIKGHGLANFHLANVGDASFDMFGTASLDCGDARTLDADLSGAGDVMVGHVAGKAFIVVAGIGDVTAQSISGRADITIMNAGNVRVLGGTLPDLTVQSIDGLGSVDVAGTVGDADINIGSKTRVHLHRVTGRLKSKTRQAALLEIDKP
ncbi:hypothetical protein QH494_03575 [Sphingomonas sp. AR_OL41]|uniref:hypothetical protein n=1 Tax=Sphingomonas sp. AR_OL41 TaxID=3042729 RepID=UPI002480E331|nr:hypothetical protein [Sphingomonas sp. AR_OL41]MDH7971249.1 hypothetical protein [Sphingomonas sp. AR_OL41]